MLAVVAQNRFVGNPEGTKKKRRFGAFFKKLVNAAINAVLSIPVLGTLVVEGVEAVVEGIAKNENIFADNYQLNAALPSTAVANPATEIPYEPTAAEQAILLPWFETKLKPYIVSMSSELADAFGDDDFNAQLEVMNNILLRIRVIKAYFAANEKTGLSAKAVTARSELIDSLLSPIENLIVTSANRHETVIQMKSVPATFTTANNAMFRPLIASLTGKYTVQQLYAADGVKIITDAPVKSPDSPSQELATNTPIVTTPAPIGPGNTPGVPLTNPKANTTPKGPTNPKAPVGGNNTLPADPIDEAQMNPYVKWGIRIAALYGLYRGAKALFTN